MSLKGLPAFRPYRYRGKQPYRGPTRQERAERRAAQTDTGKCEACGYKRSGMNHRVLCGDAW